ncbi:TRAP transporter substrate-binding protein [Geminicoccaceae bacterium 1502E]|nr:TRAP transporter substrate-binding protein [Geminicoccaceae bacterium 1502E]
MRKTLGILAVSLALASAAQAQERIRIAAAAQPGSVMEGIINTFIEKFNEGANDGYRMEFQFVGSDQELTQQVVRGRLEIGSTSLAGAAVSVPEGSVLSIPYLWSSDAERRWVTDNAARPVLEEIYEERGLTIIGLGDTGWSNVFCKTSCNTPEELEGRRFRLPPAASAKLFWDNMGVNGVQLALPDFFTGLEQGMVEGGDLPFTFYVTTPAAKFATNYVLTQNYHHDQVFFVNRRFFEGLPEDIQALLHDAMPATEDMRSRQEEDWKKRALAFEAEGGTIVPLTDEQRAAWAEKVVAGHESLVETLPGRSRDLFDAVMDGKQRYADSR